MTPRKWLVVLAAAVVPQPTRGRARATTGRMANFSATDCALTLVDDLKGARLLWKSAMPHSAPFQKTQKNPT